MADQKGSALTLITVFNGDERIYIVDDPSGTPASRAFTIDAFLDTHYPSQGGLLNGRITRTVSSNNLTMSIVTLDGSTPSATKPVYCRIGNNIRKITAALTKTYNAGVNWAGLGSTPTATFDTDVFVYLIWNTTPATDVVDFGWARTTPGPTGTYADFSTTNSNQYYLAFANASTPTSTDEVELIGRVNVTLGVTAAFNWSVPATSIIISRPIFSTRWLTWQPSPAGFSAVPTSTVYQYQMADGDCKTRWRDGANGTSNSTSFSGTAPFTAKTVTNALWSCFFSAVDNTAFPTTPSLALINSASATITFFLTAAAASTSWTAGSTGKRATYFELTFPVV